MKAAINNDIGDLLYNNADLLFTASTKNASPLHIIFPEQLALNTEAFKQTYAAQKLNPNIYYAYKTNKSRSLLLAAKEQSIGVEVSSFFELIKVLSLGFKGSKILASGPIKTRQYLQTCIDNKVLISIDDVSELDFVKKQYTRQNKKTNVLIRINIPNSRFGICLNAIHSILESKIYNNCITLKGFSFHRNDYSIHDRSQLLNTAIELVLFARKYSFKSCDSISIGGGYTVNYVDKDAWVTWQNNYGSAKQALYNNAIFTNVYPYYSEQPKELFLKAILSAKSDNIKTSTLADVLLKNNINLITEPGRSLVDQAGVTLFTITGIKYDVSEIPIIVVEGNINSLSEQWFGSDFLVDPVLVSVVSQNEQTTPQQYYVGGNLCLESDMLAKSAITLHRTPKAGDILVYINTAGYMMDSNESTFSHFPIPQKIAARKIGNKWEMTDD